MQPSRQADGLVKLGARCFALSLPLLAFITLYVILDPFRVVRQHDNYYVGAGRVMLNRDFVSLQMFEKNFPRYRYDSFILGNSRSIFYEWNDWSKYIGSDKIFHFDASSESLLGIDLKLKYLDRRCAIDNCLIILDGSALGIVTNQDGHIFTKHYRLSGQNQMAFQMKFFKAFIDKHFLRAYLDLRWHHRFRPSMGEVLDPRVWDYDAAHNELSLHSTIEAEIERGRYYQEKAGLFPLRDHVKRNAPAVIGSRQMQLLTEMREILGRQKSNYRVVISPLYDQVSLAPADAEALRKIFGADKVSDFSGVNELTSRSENYYESSHYRPVVSRAIMSKIYTENALRVSR